MAFQSLGAEGALNHTLNLLLINNFMHKFYLIMIKKKERNTRENSSKSNIYKQEKQENRHILFWQQITIIN